MDNFQGLIFWLEIEANNTPTHLVIIWCGCSFHLKWQLTRNMYSSATICLSCHKSHYPKSIVSWCLMYHLWAQTNTSASAHPPSKPPKGPRLQGVIHWQGDNQRIETIVWISMITLAGSKKIHQNRIPIFGDEGYDKWNGWWKKSCTINPLNNGRNYIPINWCRISASHQQYQRLPQS